MEKLTPKQRLKIKGPIIDTNNRLNGIFDSFDSFNNKFSPGNKLIDLFSSCFPFYFSNRKCCGNHLSQRQMITQTVNLLISSGEFTRELDKESLLN